MDHSGSVFYLKRLRLHHIIQPIIELSANKIFGYEMLLRSKDMDNPEQNFECAEKQNKLFDLDMHSIHKAFETINKHATMLDGITFVHQYTSIYGWKSCFHM